MESHRQDDMSKWELFLVLTCFNPPPVVKPGGTPGPARTLGRFGNLVALAPWAVYLYNIFRVVTIGCSSFGYRHFSCCATYFHRLVRADLNGLTVVELFLVSLVGPSDELLPVAVQFDTA